MERWLTVENHPDYEVSTLGRVRNKNTGCFLKPQLNKDGGYYRVSLNGSRYYLHRLVADAFFDGDHKLYDVNHIDGDKSNNRLSNLEWTTRQDDIRHAYESGLKFSSVVRIVRCRFCKNRYTLDICNNKPDNFYCAYGER